MERTGVTFLAQDLTPASWQISRASCRRKRTEPPCTCSMGAPQKPEGSVCARVCVPDPSRVQKGCRTEQGPGAFRGGMKAEHGGQVGLRAGVPSLLT